MFQEKFCPVKIYYDRLNSRVFRETPAYSIVQLCSDFGGVLGIVLGPSAITSVEFFYCLAGLAVYALTKGKTSIM